MLCKPISLCSHGGRAVFGWKSFFTPYMLSTFGGHQSGTAGPGATLEEKADMQDKCAHQIRLFMKEGDLVTVFLQERQWMGIPSPLVQEEAGSPWLPTEGIPFLTLQVQGRPQLQEHVPDKTTGTVYPKVDRVSKEVLKWAQNMVSTAAMGGQYKEEWEKLLVHDKVGSLHPPTMIYYCHPSRHCPPSVLLLWGNKQAVVCVQPWTKTAVELPKEHLPEYNDLPSRSDYAASSSQSMQPPTAGEVTAAHTKLPFEGIAVHMGAMPAPAPVEKRLSAFTVNELKGWLLSKGAHH